MIRHEGTFRGLFVEDRPYRECDQVGTMLIAYQRFSTSQVKGGSVHRVATVVIVESVHRMITRRVNVINFRVFLSSLQRSAYRVRIVRSRVLFVVRFPPCVDARGLPVRFATRTRFHVVSVSNVQRVQCVANVIGRKDHCEVDVASDSLIWCVYQIVVHRPRLDKRSQYRRQRILIRDRIYGRHTARHLFMAATHLRYRQVYGRLIFHPSSAEDVGEYNGKEDVRCIFWEDTSYQLLVLRRAPRRVRTHRHYQESVYFRIHTRLRHVRFRLYEVSIVRVHVIRGSPIANVIDGGVVTRPLVKAIGQGVRLIIGDYLARCLIFPVRVYR